jgi:formamidopyrimidine-DNA glycosylase
LRWARSRIDGLHEIDKSAGRLKRPVVRAHGAIRVDRQRLDPRRRANTLTDPEIMRMRAALKRVVDTSVRVSNDSDRYPRGWLFHRRWGRNPRAVTRTGERIRHITVGGRTTAWVPTRQR